MLRRASLVAQMVKNPSVMQKGWVRSQGQEDPLKKGMAIHSSSLAWRILWTETQAWAWLILSLPLKESEWKKKTEKERKKN